MTVDYIFASCLHFAEVDEHLKKKGFLVQNFVLCVTMFQLYIA